MSSTRRERTRPGRLSTCLTVLVAGLAAAACGSSSSSSSSAASGGSAPAAATTTGSSAASGCNIAAAQKALADNAALPQFHAPGPPIDTSKLKGKTIFVLPASTAIPFNSDIANAMVAAGKRVGIHVTVYPNQGQPSQWVQGMDQAIATHANAITLIATDPKLIGPQIAAAKRAGIPVVSTALYDVTDSTLPHPLQAPNLAAVVDSPFSLAAKLETDQAIVSTNCKANIVAIESAEYPNFTYMVAAAKAEVHQNCPSCHLKIINVPAVDWASKLQPNLQTALVSDPTVNWVEALVDPMTEYAVPAVVASGRTGKVRMSTFNGTPFALKYVQNGKIVTMDIAENLDWKGWAGLDQTMRAMLGETPIANDITPVRVFNTSNVSEAGNPPSYNTGVGAAYINGFLKLWNVG